MDIKEKIVSSVLTKAEIVRELLTAFHMEEKDIKSSWDDFIKSIHCDYVESFVLNARFLDIVSKIKMRLRTMMNFQHILISMQENAYFVSGNNDIIKKIKENKIYDKALTYIELRKLASSLDSSASSHTHQDA